MHRAQNDLTLVATLFPNTQYHSVSTLCVPCPIQRDNTKPDLPLSPSHQPSGPVVILASSREVSCAPQVLSDLRAVHRLSTEVRSLPAEDYVISRRAAVVRRPAAGECMWGGGVGRSLMSGGGGGEAREGWILEMPFSGK